ncbi:hypothetical protein BurJ1DRAFT_2881 [Burkholderiales bacterium JOSHI_001]|nr:hypothetical protein BurJ1DRAFT_2881 [Burkholderiales bacterium JOSHI_001]
MPHRPILLRLLLAPLLLLGAATATAQSVPSTLNTATTLGFERVRFGSGERLGLVGGSLLFEGGRNWWFGPAVYGAASGQRGGFFVGGLEVQQRIRLGPRSGVVLGLYAGGGGGGSSPVGGGLMLRPAVTLVQDLGGLQAGLSLSQVRFPSGDIRSNQLGLVLGWDGSFRATDPARAGRAPGLYGRTGLGMDHLLITAGRYAPRGGGASIGLIGARALRSVGDWHLGIESAAAAQGSAAGYMEILAEAGTGWPVTPRLNLGVRGALGLGGGGAVPVGGGVLAKLAVGGAYQLSPHLHLGAELGLVDALNGSFRAGTAQLWLAMALEPMSGDGRVVRYEWAPALQHNLRAQRKDGSRGTLDTIGLRLNRWVDGHWYLSAQAHSAYAGGAGAYSIGLVGAGVGTAPVAQGWQFGAELLVGAAGGGGVNTAGGAIVQGLGWAGYALSPDTMLRLGLGGVKSLKGDLSSPVLEVSWQRAFGLNGP